MSVEILSWLTLLVAMPLNWLVTVFLWRLLRAAPKLRVLRERVIVAFSLSLIVTVYALIFVNNDMKPPPLNFESTKVFTRGGLLVMATIPALYWLLIYWRIKRG